MCVFVAYLRVRYVTHVSYVMVLRARCYGVIGVTRETGSFEDQWAGRIGGQIVIAALA